MTPLLEINNIHCRYQGNTIIEDLSFHVNKGSIACLLGPSGGGKTTVLRAIAGFVPIDSGEIVLRGITASRSGYSLAPDKRRLGMVFQDYALFPHLNVTDNICFGLRGMTPKAKRKTSQRLLEIVGLKNLDKRFPHELSGGQQQRIALARTLAARPDLVLMDEPFSNLDIDLRERLSHEVHNILKEHGITTLIVTHDQTEAFALSDVVGILHHRKIVQWDTPFSLYHEPCNRFVADFIGQGTFLKGTLLGPDKTETEIGIIKGNRAYQWEKGTSVDVLIRPDDIVPDQMSPLRGVVANKAFQGAQTLYTLRLPSGNTILSLFPSHHDHLIGEDVGFRIDADHLIAFRNQA